MERIVKNYSERSKRKMTLGIKKITKAHQERQRKLQDESYAKVKAGEACPYCAKPYDVSNKNHCTCDNDFDEMRDNRMSENSDGN